MSANFNVEDEDDGFSEINITPLTDIFLVLLIIFMVTSTVPVSYTHLDVYKRQE